MTARERAEAARVQYAGTVFDEPWIAGLYDALTDLLAETAEGGVGCGDGGGCAGRGGGAAMSDRMPTTAEVRERFIDGFPMDTWAVSRDECGRDFDRWLAAYTAGKQAEALQLAAKAIQGRVDPKATHCAVHVNAGLMLACDELSDQAQRLRDDLEQDG